MGLKLSISLWISSNLNIAWYSIGYELHENCSVEFKFHQKSEWWKFLSLAVLQRRICRKFAFRKHKSFHRKNKQISRIWQLGVCHQVGTCHRDSKCHAIDKSPFTVECHAIDKSPFTVECHAISKSPNFKLDPPKHVLPKNKFSLTCPGPRSTFVQISSKPVERVSRNQTQKK